MKTNDTTVVLRPSDIERFWSKVIKSAGCWVWNGTVQQKGYGTLMVQARRRCTAHRLSWIINRGPIPEGKWILHHCDTPWCVNPEHLFLGDHIENMRDARTKGRMSRLGHAWKYRGERNKRAKATELIVREIRSLSGTMRHRDIAQKFGLSKSCVSHIIGRRVWKHVP